MHKAFMCHVSVSHGIDDASLPDWATIRYLCMKSTSGPANVKRRDALSSQSLSSRAREECRKSILSGDTTD